MSTPTSQPAPFPGTAADVLPSDPAGTYLTRVYAPERRRPIVAAYRAGALWDASGLWTTAAEAAEAPDLNARLAGLLAGPADWSAEDVALPAGDQGDGSTGPATASPSSGGSRPDSRPSRLTLLPPVDLQVLKACGVTYAGSMIERVIEERAHGDPALADGIREEMRAAVGADLSGIAPGSGQAAALKADLQERGWWSQYLEVGLGPDPEVFTKAPVLSSVGSGDHIGIPAFSSWNNPEPELVLIVNSHGTIVGVTLGNDVNLRDVEGRSALLLGMAKDNNRSTALGPAIRVFDETFSPADASALEIELAVAGADGFELHATNTVSALSRSFEELAGAVLGAHHQYPDGCAIMTGTLFAPTQDRRAPGQGFTHETGDVVSISAPELGRLVNRVGPAEELAPWTYGIRELMADLNWTGPNRADLRHADHPSARA